MNSQEIQVLKEAVTEAEFEKIDNEQEEDAIYAMSESEGWRIMVKKANKTMCDLLEPVDSTKLPADANHLLIIANSFANAKTLKVFREFISQAESVKKVRRVMKERKSQEDSVQDE